MFLPSWWTWIEGFAAGKFHAGNNKMQFVVSCVAMAYPGNITLIRLQASEGHTLKIIHYLSFLLRCHHVVWVPGKDARCEFPFRIQGIYEYMGKLQVAAQYFRRVFFTPWIIQAHKILGRAFPATLTMWKDFHIHGISSELSDSGGGGVSLNIRSRLTSAASTSIVSAWFLCVLAHRASWFKLAPMRASCRTRSFSKGVCRSR